MTTPTHSIGTPARTQRCRKMTPLCLIVSLLVGPSALAQSTPTAAGPSSSADLSVPAPDVAPPTVGIIGGNHQTAKAGQFNARPFDIAVWDASGTQPLIDVPVTLTVETGDGRLAATNTATAPLTSTLTLTTDADGTVQAYYQHAATPGLLSKIKAVAGSREVVLQTTSLGAAAANPEKAAGSDEPAGATSSDKSAASSLKPARDRGAIGLMLASQSSLKGDAAKKTVKAQALASAFGCPVVLRTPANRFYAVNTATWEITATSAPAP